MTVRSRSFCLGAVVAMPCCVLAWTLLRLSGARSHPAPTPPDRPLADSVAETPEQRRQRQEAWVAALNAATPDEAWSTKAPASVTEAETRLRALREVTALSAAELLALLDSEKRRGGETTLGTLRLLIGALARHDPEAALRWMKGNLNRSAKWDVCWQDVGRVWALEAPQGFAAWFGKGADAEYRDHFHFASYVTTWVAARDLRLAAELTAEKKSASVRMGRDGFGQHIRTPEDVATVRAVLDQNPPRAPRKLADGRLNYSGGGSARDLQRSLEVAWPMADPAGWEAHLATHPTGAHGEDLWLNARVATLQATDAPAQAAEGILSDLLPDADREAAVLAIVCTWSTTDPQAAIDWGAAKVGADGRERLVSAVAGPLFRTDPAAAVDLWQQLPESPRRSDSLADAFDRWHALDAAAAERFRQGAKWSAEVDRAIRERQLTRPAASRKNGAL